MGLIPNLINLSFDITSITYGTAYLRHKVVNYSNSTHLIILLHGIGKNSSSLKGLKTYLNKEGFSVLNIDYPSTKYSIEELTDIIHNNIC